MNNRQNKKTELTLLSQGKEGDTHKSSYKSGNIIYDVLSHPAQTGPHMDDILFDIAEKGLMDTKIQQRRSA